MVPVKREIYICYFDLRKYSFLDKNFSISKQILFLEDYHNIVEEKCLKNDGILYHLNSDTCVYYFYPGLLDLVQVLIDIKEEVDQYFIDMDFPCRLHISVAYGSGLFGEINTRKSKTKNIFGSVMNSLQRTICFSESEFGKNSNDRIVLHESLKEQINEELVFERTSFNETEFISLK
jgi:hypothetical protein